MRRRGRAAAGAVLGAGLAVVVGCAGAGAGTSGRVAAPLPIEGPAAQDEQEIGRATADEPDPPPAAPAAPPADLATVAQAPPSRSSSRGAGEVAETGASRPASDAHPDRASNPVRQELIVVDEGSGAVRPSPGELARTTRRETAGQGSSPRITNDNLADYARRGQVTMSGTPVAGKPAAGEAGEAAAGAGTADAVEPVRDEAWWRGRAREIREEWRRTVDEIDELEAAAADLRWRFYAEDDPWVRDGDVKPEWDRALDRLSEARRRLEEYPRQLDELVEEGRREGALPGWLREGIELEPAPEELPGAAADPAEPVEPREVDETSPGDGW